MLCGVLQQYAEQAVLRHRLAQLLLLLDHVRCPIVIYVLRQLTLIEDPLRVQLLEADPNDPEIGWVLEIVPLIEFNLVTE